MAEVSLGSSSPPEAAEDPLRIVVCTVTFRRPRSLAWSLDAIGRFEVPPGVELRALVVDNDEGRTAREVVAGRVVGGHGVTYVVEERRGIPHARNRAVACAGDVDLLAFVDDDEAPEPTWLDAALDTWRATHAEVVVGPSIPAYDERAPAWVVDGGFFDRQRFVTGTSISPNFARTSGVLIVRHALPPQPVFDERFPLSGGSDFHLFQKITDDGGRLVWCDEARVVERVPPSRTTARWLVMRRYRIGNTRSLRTMPSGATGLPRRLRRIGRGLLDAAIGVGELVASVGQGRGARVRALQDVAYGMGLVTGAVGIPYREYRVVHGD
jgi:succinoglycan biosynthesis protein ExoM